MNRRSFLRILPGMFAVKQIAAQIKPIPAVADIVDTSSGLYFQLTKGNLVTYSKGSFSLQMFKDVISNLYGKDHPTNVVYPVKRSEYEIFDQELRDRYKYVLNRYRY